MADLHLVALMMRTNSDTLCKLTEKDKEWNEYTKEDLSPIIKNIEKSIEQMKYMLEKNSNKQ